MIKLLLIKLRKLKVIVDNYGMQSGDLQNCFQLQKVNLIHNKT